MINIKKWVKNAILSRAGDRKSPKKCNILNITSPNFSYDKRFSNGRFVLFKHNRMKQEKSNWYVEEPKIYHQIEGNKLVSLIIQYHDWQFQWEI